MATTSGALFIGVTLVAMMSTGAASATRTFTEELAARYPVDVAAQTVSDGEGYPALPGSLIDQMAAVDGVAQAVSVRASDYLTVDGGSLETVYAADAEQVAVVLNDPGLAAAFDDSGILLTSRSAVTIGVGVGDVVTLEGPDGSVAVTVRAVDSAMPLIGTPAMAELDASAAASGLWLRLGDRAEAAVTVADLQSLASKESDALVQIAGMAVERAFFQR
ncbi:MAG TPA: hypothetical protein PKB06_09090, partial [Actinotalea sp.]|nr:hypothetical protein [Actinotalea sp.]